jgi:hypothetical protein
MIFSKIFKRVSIDSETGFRIYCIDSMSSLTVLVILLLNFYLEYQFHEIQTIYGFYDHIIFKIDLKEKIEYNIVFNSILFLFYSVPFNRSIASTNLASVALMCISSFV